MEKVWIYLSDKVLEGTLLSEIKDRGEAFVKNWKAHENPLNATFEVLHNRFLIVKVNEAIFNASGCSIDKLLRFVKELETDFKIQLLNRLLVACKIDNEIEVMPSHKVKDILALGELNENSIVYNTAASNTFEFLNWEQPLKETWLKKYLSLA